MVSIIPEDADDIAATVSLRIVQKLQASLFFEEEACGAATTTPE